MEFLLQGLILGVTAGSQPGAFQAYLLERALRDGWRGTWTSALAPLISDGPIVLIVLLLLTRVPDWLARGLRLAGGCFLLYLAWGVLRGLRASERAAEKQQPDAAQMTGGQKNLFQSALINFLNPAPWLFWSTVAGPAFLRGWNIAPAHGLSFVLGFYGAMLSFLIGLVALFAAAGRLNAGAVRWMHIFSGILLAGFALYQFSQAFLS